MDTSAFPRWTVFCIDFKSYYSSVECMLRGLDPLETYLVVVGDIDRPGSVVLASSPNMKKEYGIKTGSRRYEIPNDPRIHIVNARMKTYLEFSMQVPKILNQFGPMENIYVYSVDEAFFVYDAENLYGDKWTAARLIQSRLQKELGLPNAIGIGENYFMAKSCLDVLAKHDTKNGYIAELSYRTFNQKMWGFPIREIWGIGHRMERNLNRMGIFKLGDLARTPVTLLKKKFGVIGEQLYYHAWGVDLTNPYYHPDREDEHLHQKGFGSGITLLRDYIGEDILTVIMEKADEIAWRARDAHMTGRTISLSIGYSRDENGPHGGFSHAKTIPYPTNNGTQIYQVCKELFNVYYTGEVVRQVHVSLTNLQDDRIVQLDLFEDDTKQRNLDAVADHIRKKYGTAALFRARSLTSGGTIVERSTMIGGHKA